MSDENRKETERTERPGFRSSGGPRGNRDGDDRGGRRRSPYGKKKMCRFCTRVNELSYRKPETLRRYVTERGKILPRRITGTCARHQRQLTREIKRARILALLPFVARS